MDVFLKGLAVGLAISIPMGPVGVFAIHRVIAHKKLSGLIVGLGSAVADAVFGIIAIYGLASITLMINAHHKGLSVFGGALLLYIAINIFFSKPKEKVVYDVYYTLSKDFATGFVLTITNPLTLLAILALFAWFGLNGASSSIISAVVLLVGFMAGLVLWWFGLTSVTDHIKQKVNVLSFKIINQVFGGILFVLAILILVKVL